MSLNTAQQIIFDVLNGNITGGVYNHVPYLPEGMPAGYFPYTVMGRDSADPWDNDSFTGINVNAELHIWSRSEGGKECKTIMKQIYDLLHRGTFTKTNYDVVDSLCVFQDVLDDPDGKTVHGVMRFRLTLQDV